jgi:small-conductance mechanosensitive channel
MSLSKNRRQSHRQSAWVLALGVFAVAFLLSAASVPAAAETVAAPPKAPAETPAPAPSAISAAEVPLQSVGVSAFLRTLDRELETVRGDIGRVAEEFSGGNVQLGEERAITLAALEREQLIWQQRQKRALGWMKALTDRATSLQEGADRLAALHTVWAATRQAALSSQEPASVLHEIGRTTGAIEAAQAPLRERRAQLLTLLSGIVGEADQCGKALDRITQIRDKSVAGAFHPDSPVLWSPGLWNRPWNEVSDDMGALHEIAVGTLADYAWGATGGFRVDAALLAVLVCMMLAARRWVRRRDDAGLFEASVSGVFEHPYATALTLALLYRTSPFTDVPGMGRGILQILTIVPAILIVRPAVHPLVLRGLWVLGGLFAVDVFRQAVAGVPPIGQASLLFENLAGLAVAGWLLWRLRPRDGAGVPPWLPAMRLPVAVVFLTFLFSLAAGVFGYQLLARLVTSGVLSVSALALRLYASLLVLNGMAALALHLWPLRTLRLVQCHRDLLLRRTFRLLVFVAMLSGLGRALDYLGLLIPVAEFSRALLNAKLERGSLSVTPGDIIAFLITVYAAHLSSVFLRFVLNEEVYPRTSITAGASYAASSLLHYVILAVGFMLALGMMGVDFTRVTVLAGAFSVGLGFGLQSVVHNFVSGLILLFERPVHVGDAIETASIQGEVRRIGIRASVVRTPQGAEVMVPNSQLVSEKVTNWTLSDRRRRIDLPLGINYGANAADVVALVESVARANPAVMASPPPRCFLVAYGESGVNFELRAWTDQFDKWFQVRSELALGVYKAVEAAPGMEFPLPQREEARLLNEPNGGPARNPSGVSGGMPARQCGGLEEQ